MLYKNNNHTDLVQISRGDRYDRYNDNGDGVKVVLATKPQGTTKQLEYVERMKSLQLLHIKQNLPVI